LDVQDRHRVRRARAEAPETHRRRRHQSRHDPLRLARRGRGQAPQLRRAVVHGRHRQVEQRRRDQDRSPRGRATHGAVRPPLRVRPPDVPRLSVGEPGHPVGSIAAGRGRARVDVDGLPGWRDAAAEVTAIMEAVIERGTGRSAQIDGYTVAGKTGTAQKVENGRYSNTDYNVSFVGFVTSRTPVFTIVVVVDSPHRVPPYGATVAAPIFRRIAAAALQQYGVPPSINRAPPVLAMRRDATDEGASPLDADQVKPFDSARARPLDSGAGRPMATAGVGPNIVTVSSGAPRAAAVFPDLRGLSARDALRTLSRLGMTARLNGAGIVVRQVPQAGTPIDRETASTLWLERQLAAVP